MKVVTLKLKNQREWNFLRSLLQRLNVTFEILDVKPTTPIPQNDSISELFGSWKSEESSDELIKTIYEARVSQQNNIDL